MSKTQCKTEKRAFIIRSVKLFGGEIHSPESWYYFDMCCERKGLLCFLISLVFIMEKKKAFTIRQRACLVKFVHSCIKDLCTTSILVYLFHRYILSL